MILFYFSLGVYVFRVHTEKGAGKRGISQRKIQNEQRAGPIWSRPSSLGSYRATNPIAYPGP